MSASRSTPPERTVVPNRSVTLSNDVVRVGSPEILHDSSAPGHGEPKLEVIRLGDRIQAIDVICSCGQRTRIRCVYE